MTTSHSEAGAPTIVAGEPAYDAQIVKDLANHAWTRMRPALFDVIGLAETPLTAFHVAVMLLSQTAGACGATAGRLYDLGQSGEGVRTATLAVLDLVREVVAEGVDGFLAKQAKAAAATPLRWRHHKRGTEYVEVGRAKVQASTRPITEVDTVVVYRGEDGTLYAREEDEFGDGRFVRMTEGKP